MKACKFGIVSIALRSNINSSRYKFNVLYQRYANIGILLSTMNTLKILWGTSACNENSCDSLVLPPPFSFIYSTRMKVSIASHAL